VMRLLRLILKAGGKRGVPQGGVISPLLSNIYLNETNKMLERAKEVNPLGEVNRESVVREIRMLRLTRRGLEPGFREPRQSSTLPVGAWG
jgi:retron-type reverse transcriptase